MAKPSTIIVRGGRVIDPRSRGQGPADILIAGDTIVEVGPPGMAAPADALHVDATDRAIMPGLVNGHVHGHGTLGKGLVEDRWPLELFLNALPGISRQPYPRGQVSEWARVRGRDDPQGLYGLLRPLFEFPIPSREGVNAIGRAYSDAGVRAVIAPMVADMTLYHAYPGLMDAIPEATARSGRTHPAGIFRRHR